jgi:hypothetical protein
LVIVATFIFSLSAGFGEYAIVDRDGKVLSEDAKKVVTISSGEKVEFYDKADRKVFEVEWDPSGKKLIVKGDNVYLQIHGTGTVEKLTTINEDDNKQQPILIQPVIPIYPRQAPGSTAPAATTPGSKPPSSTK